MSNSPIPFPSANVPIVGQVCAFHDVQPDVLISCSCEGPFADRLIRFKQFGAVGKCRACGRHLAVTSMKFDMRTQQVQITVDPVAVREGPDLGKALQDARDTLAQSALPEA